MKSLDDIKADMSRLYDEVNSGRTDVKVAAELANIAGKYLKAEQLQLAREVFLSHNSRTAEKIDGMSTGDDGGKNATVRLLT